MKNAVTVVTMKPAVLWLRHHLVWYIDINISEEHALNSFSVAPTPMLEAADSSRTSTYPPNHMDHISSLRMSPLINLFYLFIYLHSN
jgi:hypothetical protein